VGAAILSDMMAVVEGRGFKWVVVVVFGYDDV
jgi:hypothetical protein